MYVHLIKHRNKVTNQIHPYNRKKLPHTGNIMADDISCYLCVPLDLKSYAGKLDIYPRPSSTAGAYADV